MKDSIINWLLHGGPVPIGKKWPKVQLPDGYEEDAVDKATKEAEENPEYFEEDSDRSWRDYQ